MKSVSPDRLLKCFPSLLVVLVAALSGCGGASETVPIGTASGTVTLKGQPLTVGRVNFVATGGGASAFGDLSPEGAFTIPGPLPTGDYSVYLTPVGLGDTPPSENPAQDKPTPLEGVAKSYLDPQTTDLKAIVKEGKNSFKFDLQP